MALHQGLDLVHRKPEDHAPPDRGDGVVQVDDDPARTLHTAYGFADQVLAQLGHHHGRDVGGNPLLFHKLADHLEIGARGGGESHFDFLEAQAHQFLEQAQLALAVHRLEQRLVAIAQVGGQPDRSLGDGT